jgi:hypothetical protein
VLDAVSTKDQHRGARRLDRNLTQLARWQTVIVTVLSVESLLKVSSNKVSVLVCRPLAETGPVGGTGST